jgi:hypothetical protein
VIILSRGVMDELQKHDKLASIDLVNVAGTPLSIAARAGALKPDLSTADALKHALLNPTCAESTFGSRQINALAKKSSLHFGAS